MLLLYGEVLHVGVEALVVELVQVGRVQDGHIDIALPKQIVHNGLFAIVAELFEWPDCICRTQGAVVGKEALDPALAVVGSPVLRPCVPEVGVTVDDENILAVMPVHSPFPCFVLYPRYAWRAWLGRMRHWLPERRARSVSAGNRSPNYPQPPRPRLDPQSAARKPSSPDRARAGARNIGRSPRRWLHADHHARTAGQSPQVARRSRVAAAT